MASVTGFGIEPAWTSTVKPFGKTTVTDPPEVESLPNPQTGNDASESPMRRSRVAAPPGSGRSKRSRYVAVLPLYSFWARPSRRSV